MTGEQHVQASPSHTKTILFLSLTIWLVVMNTTMFNVALPNVLKDFSLAPSEGAWIVSGYSIVLAICTITYTRLADYIPIKRLLIIGITIFGIASLTGFFANTFAWLLLSRLFQAAGAAAIPGLSMVFAGRFVPLKRRGRALAMIASASSLGFGLGPVVGGVITDYLNWNYLFLITLCVLGMIPVLYRFLPNETTRKGYFDVWGGFLTGIGITFFLLFISTFHWYYFAGAAVFFGGLWIRIHKIEIPFIQPSLIRDKGYRQILYMSFLGFVTHFAILIVMPLMLQHVFGKNPTAVGFIIFPGAMLSAVAAIFVGRLIDRYGNIRVMFLAHILLIVSTVLFYLLSPHSEYMIMLAYMFTSFGFSSLSSSSTNEVSRVMSKELTASGIGMKQLIHFVGSASGSVLGGIIVEMGGADFPVSSFQITFLVLIGIMTVSLLLLLIYRRHVHPS
ncbi:MFS transporter [Rossellomorea sp. YZS02]|uniref:MFS transporter n=1 Tax=Rossellomorea sp. YZS02 TaxID=3097358 RepID=UPI002A0C097A|nr:MFS transporter [Rossellomorea sp. YZS02]MDX8345414.1 MFS transporter [Rossellomorea sp. YZS02]